MRRKTSRVLIVEDDRVIARVHQQLLEDEGFTVAVVESGEQALEKVESLHPDVILLDILLPGKDGIEVARELADRPATRDIPIVIVTGAESFPVGRGFEDLDNVCRFLYKPVPEHSLVPAVDEALLRHPQGDHR